MFDLKLEGGDKEAGQNAVQNTEVNKFSFWELKNNKKDNATPTSQSITPIKSIPKEQHLNTNLTVPTDVGSPIYNVGIASSPFSKVGTYLTVDTNAGKEFELICI